MTSQKGTDDWRQSEEGTPDNADLLASGALPLAVALASALHIEPELIRAMRLRVRPALDVSAEAALWYGPWAAHRGARSMALRRSVQQRMRARLIDELRESQRDAPLRLAGVIISAAHAGTSQLLALEERITWAAILADAGIDDHTTPFHVDRLLQSALHTADREPMRRDGMRRWFTQAWHRLPQRVRENPNALDLYELLAGPSGDSYWGQPVPLATPRIADVVLPVRHDGARLVFGDATWPAAGILVPDTQPRVLQASPHKAAWDDAIEVRVTRRGTAVIPATHVPMYVRTARGQIYEVGAPDTSNLIEPPLVFSDPARQLLGHHVGNLRDQDYVHFGIAPPLSALRLPSADLVLRRDVVPRSTASLQQLPPPPPTAAANQLRHLLSDHAAGVFSGLIAVRGSHANGPGRAAAWQAMRDVLDHWLVWTPPVIDRNRAVLQALASDGIGAQTVVWLDDLDVCLTESATGEEVARTVLALLDDEQRRPVVVLATLQAKAGRQDTLGPVATALLHRSEIVDFPDDDGPYAGGEFPVPRPTSNLPPARSIDAHETDLERVLVSLTEPIEGIPLTVITGLPGTGTSSLAVKAAHQAALRGLYAGGVMYISLADAPRDPWTALLKSLNPRFSGRVMPRRTLRQFVAQQLMLTGDTSRPVLLVFDDASEKNLREILAVTPPGFSILATSSTRITLKQARTVRLGTLTQEGSLLLLQHHLDQERGTDPRLHQEPKAARALAKLCGYYPLALTFAARQLAREPNSTVGQFVETLGEYYILDLSESDGGSLRNFLDDVIRPLTDTQVAIFCALSWLPGTSFSVDTAQHLLGEVIPLESELAQIESVNLLTRQQAGRWSIHPFAQRYGRSLSQRLLGEKRSEHNQRKIVHYYLARTREADSLMRRERPRDAKDHLKWLEAERGNIVSLAYGCLRSDSPYAGAELAMKISLFLYQQGEFSTLLSLMKMVYALAAESGDDDSKAKALNNLAVSSAALGDFQRARSALQTASRLPYALRQREDYLGMLSSLGAVLLRSDQTDEAIELLADAVSQHDNKRPAARISLLCNLGAALHQAGDVPQALRTLLRAEQLADHYPLSPADRAPLHRNLAEALKDSDRMAEAEIHYRRALDCHAQTGNHRAEAALHQHVARVMLRTKRSSEALYHLQVAQELYQRMSDTAAEAQVCDAQGRLLSQENRYEEALDLLLQARTLYQAAQREANAASTLHSIGQVLLLLHRYEEAIPALRNASAHLEAVGDQIGEARALHQLAMALRRADDNARAKEALYRSGSLYLQLHLQQEYAQPALPGGAPSVNRTMSGIAEQAHLENALLSEADELRRDLLDLAHELATQNDEAADPMFRLALELPSSAGGAMGPADTPTE